MNRIVKQGIFYRIVTGDGKYISKKKFLRLMSAVNYLDMQDRHGMPVEEYKGDKK